MDAAPNGRRRLPLWAGLLTLYALLIVAWVCFRPRPAPPAPVLLATQAAPQDAPVWNGNTVNWIDPPEGESSGPLRCSLTRWPNDPEETDPSLKLELTNISAYSLRIAYHTFPICHITFYVRDRNGRAVNMFHWATLSSHSQGIDSRGRRTDTLSELKLQPGEVYMQRMYLRTIRYVMEPVSPGRYRLDAIYTWNGVARSWGVDLEVGPERDEKGKPLWRLPPPTPHFRRGGIESKASQPLSPGQSP